jgi:site-specific recombinase XerD
VARLCVSLLRARDPCADTRGPDARRGGQEEGNNTLLLTFLEALRTRGWRTVSINTRCRSLNVFFKWLHAEGHLTKPLRFRKLKEEKTVIPTLSDIEQKRLVAFKPKGFGQTRAHLLALTLLDSGIRIDEALGLRQSDVNYDDLLMTVTGKGRKQRSSRCR